MVPPNDNHDCGWRHIAEESNARAEALEQQVTSLQVQLDELKRQVFGRKSERVHVEPIERELRRELSDEEARQILEQALALRRAHAAERTELPRRTELHTVPEAKRVCPSCGGHNLRSVGEGKKSEEIECEPRAFVLVEHVQQTLACRDCEHIFNAPAPVRVGEKCRYGPGFVAHLITSKCCDSLPFYRLQKQMARSKVHINRSTMVGLFLRAGELLAPLADRQKTIIAAAKIVQADETPLKRQAKDKAASGYMWTFLTKLKTGESLISYQYSASRSGETPEAVLKQTKGTLLVDAYSGYNKVCTPQSRERAGCLAHVRRKFYTAKSTAPEAAEAVALIREVYLVEREAARGEIKGTSKHLALRQEKSKPAMERLRNWLDEQAAKRPPKSPLGEAVSYALNQWDALIKFLDDEQLPVDNNASEQALRVVALGRKNYLFVGNEIAGDKLADLYSLAKTCEANGINPEVYFTDVLIRIHSHPQSKIDQLLPHNWAKHFGAKIASPRGGGP